MLIGYAFGKYLGSSSCSNAFFLQKTEGSFVPEPEFDAIKVDWACLAMVGRIFDWGWSKEFPEEYAIGR